MDRFTTKESPKTELLGCVYCPEYSNCYSNMSCNEIYNALSKLRYYEDLDEQGRLIIIASDEDQLKTFEDKCWICPHWNGKSCNKTQCLIYIKKEELRNKLGK